MLKTKTFFSQLEELFQRRLSEAPSLSRALRQKAWNRFLQLGLPKKKEEAFQYFPLTQLYGADLVFVDGKFSQELSALPKEVVCLPLAASYQTYGSFLHARLEKGLAQELNPFVCLNLALESEGCFLFVPPNVIVEKPLRCRYLFSQECPAMVFPRLQLFLGQGASLTLLTEVQGGAAPFSNAVLDCVLEKRSCLKWTSFTHLEQPVWHFDSLRATLKKESVLESVHVNTGGKAVRQDFCVQLQGERAEAALNGLSLLTGSRQTHTHVLMKHEAPHTRSSQLFKTILADTSRFSFSGKIYVCREAQKTEAYQSNHNLLLSPHALAYSKPNLEIFADDVKASHGATVSKLKEDHLFYLKTRGLPMEIAKKLLVIAFGQEIIHKVVYPDFTQQMQKQIEDIVR